MAIPPFLLASSLRLVVAQRLIRKVCDECKRSYEVDEATLVDYGYVSRGVGKVTLYKGRGCAACTHTGLKGRVAIYEILPSRARSGIACSGTRRRRRSARSRATRAC